MQSSSPSICSKCWKTNSRCGTNVWGSENWSFSCLLSYVFCEGMLHSASILPLHSCERMKSNRHETFQYWTVGQCKITQDASISTYPPGLWQYERHLEGLEAIKRSWQISTFSVTALYWPTVSMTDDWTNHDSNFLCCSVTKRFCCLSEN